MENCGLIWVILGRRSTIRDALATRCVPAESRARVAGWERKTADWQTIGHLEQADSQTTGHLPRSV